MIYSFNCVSRDHKNPKTKSFDTVVHGIPSEKVITQYPCPECGGIAKRAFDREIPTQSVVGITPVSHATTGKGSLFKETSMAFGRFEKNPDGSEDKNKPRFRDSGEVNKYLNGQNELGDPVTDDKGEPVKRPDGTIIRRGAKLFKYSAGAAPSRDGISNKRSIPKGAKWVDGRTANAYGDSRISKGQIYTK